MDKLAIFKGRGERLAHLIRPTNNARQHAFKDRLADPRMKNVEFKHSWATMAHMHDLRVWTIAYAPGKRNNLQRLQEIHRLNNEMWYQVSQALYKRIFAMIFLWFFFTKIAKQRFMTVQAKDSHETSMADHPAYE